MKQSQLQTLQAGVTHSEAPFAFAALMSSGAKACSKGSDLLCHVRVPDGDQ